MVSVPTRSFPRTPILAGHRAQSLPWRKRAIALICAPTEHKPRGRLTVAQLLSQIDENEIKALNQSSEGWAEEKKGNEAW